MNISWISFKIWNKTWTILKNLEKSWTYFFKCNKTWIFFKYNKTFKILNKTLKIIKISFRFLNKTENNHKQIFFNLTKHKYTHASGHVNFWDFKLVRTRKRFHTSILFKLSEIIPVTRQYVIESIEFVLKYQNELTCSTQPEWILKKSKWI